MLMNPQYFLVDTSVSMAAFQQQTADVIWALAALLKPRVANRGDITLSVFDGAEYGTFSSSNHNAAELAKRVRKRSFTNTASWVVQDWYANVADGAL